MNLLLNLSTLALRPVLGDGAEAVARFVSDRVGDGSARLFFALKEAGDRAWRALEVALAGPSWWDRVKGGLAAAEERHFRAQIQAFLDAAPLEGPAGDGPPFRALCLRELRQARKDGLLPGVQPPADALAERARELARYADPQAALDAEWRAVASLADDLARAGHANLALLVGTRPAGGPPLLVVAVRFFFRGLVESDPVLAKRLPLEQMDRLARSQEAAFRGLGEVLAGQGAKLDALLAGVGEVLDAVADVRREVADLARQNAELARLLEQVLAARPAAPPTRDEVRAAAAEAREALTPQQRAKLPAIFFALGELERRSDPPAAGPPPAGGRKLINDKLFRPGSAGAGPPKRSPLFDRPPGERGA